MSIDPLPADGDPAKPAPPRLAVNPTEAARALGVSRDAFYGLLRAGKIRSVKVGRRRLIPLDALRRFLGEEVTGAEAAG